MLGGRKRTAACWRWGEGRTMTFGTSSVNGRDMQEKKEKVEKLLLLEKRRHGWACDLLSLL